LSSLLVVHGAYYISYKCGTLSDRASCLRVVNVTGQDWKCMADDNMPVFLQAWLMGLAIGALSSTVSSVDVAVSHIHAALSHCAQA
jgi:hypothetical protein